MKGKRWVKEKKEIYNLAKNNKHDHIKYELWVYDREDKKWYIYSYSKDLDHIIIFYVIERGKIYYNLHQAEYIPPFD